MRKRKKSMFAAIFTIFIATLLFLPGLIGAGDMEPSDVPGPTMKTLDQIPPTWSQKLPASERFELVLDGEAVLDKETGLVWEQSPSFGLSNWQTARQRCYGLEISGRKGWRVPSVEELSSLVDGTQSPSLPSGHPFDNIQLDYSYWSSTSKSYDTLTAFVMNFNDGFLRFSGKGLTSPNYTWCLRFGPRFDGH